MKIRCDNLEYITEFPVLTVGEIEESLIDSLLDDIPLFVFNFNPNIIIGCVRRLLVALLILTSEMPALKKHEKGAQSIASRDDAPRYIISEK